VNSDLEGSLEALKESDDVGFQGTGLSVGGKNVLFLARAQDQILVFKIK
jgi:hypothetical protein